MSKILNIDNSLLGKIENNLRNPSDDLINIFSKRFNIDLNMLIVASQSDKMVEFLKRSPQELKDKILEKYTWEKTAEETIKAYQLSIK